MDIKFDPRLIALVPDLLIGSAVIDDVSIDESSSEAKNMMRAAEDSVRSKYADAKSMCYSPHIKGMRDVFRKGGSDPTRYRPSAEALLKRILDNKELFNVNNVVDMNNVGSIRFELPMGVYNLEKVVGNISFSFGTLQDVMQTMAKGTLRTQGILISKDDEKIFGSPVSDSESTKVSDETKRIMLLVYGPPSATQGYVTDALGFTSDRIAYYSKGRVIDSRLFVAKDNPKVS